MSIAGYIIIGIVILFLVGFYILLVISYLGTSKGYREAAKTDALILEDMGEVKLATGSHAIGFPRFRTFHKYRVSYYAEGREQIEEVDLRSGKRKVGDHVEVRYHVSTKGSIGLESEAFLCWLREMTIGYTVGLLLGVILAVFKMNV